MQGIVWARRPAAPHNHGAAFGLCSPRQWQQHQSGDADHPALAPSPPASPQVARQQDAGAAPDQPPADACPSSPAHHLVQWQRLRSAGARPSRLRHPPRGAAEPHHGPSPRHEAPPAHALRQHPRQHAEPQPPAHHHQQQQPAHPPDAPLDASQAAEDADAGADSERREMFERRLHDERRRYLLSHGPSAARLDEHLIGWAGEALAAAAEAAGGGAAAAGGGLGALEEMPSAALSDPTPTATAASGPTAQIAAPKGPEPTKPPEAPASPEQQPAARPLVGAFRLRRPRPAGAAAAAAGAAAAAAGAAAAAAPAARGAATAFKDAETQVSDKLPLLKLDEAPAPETDAAPPCAAAAAAAPLQLQGLKRGSLPASDELRTAQQAALKLCTRAGRLRRAACAGAGAGQQDLPPLQGADAPPLSAERRQQMLEQLVRYERRRNLNARGRKANGPIDIQSEPGAEPASCGAEAPSEPQLPLPPPQAPLTPPQPGPGTPIPKPWARGGSGGEAGCNSGSTSCDDAQPPPRPSSPVQMPVPWLEGARAALRTHSATAAELAAAAAVADSPESKLLSEESSFADNDRCIICAANAKEVVFLHNSSVHRCVDTSEA
jgi:hypothetical protein